MSSWIKWKTQTTGEPASIMLTHSDLQFLANCVLFPCRRTVHDKQTGSDIVLSDEQVELVNRLQKGQFGDVNFNEYEVRSPWWKETVYVANTRRLSDRCGSSPSASGGVLQ